MEHVYLNTYLGNDEITVDGTVTDMTIDTGLEELIEFKWGKYLNRKETAKRMSPFL